MYFKKYFKIVFDLMLNCVVQLGRMKTQRKREREKKEIEEERKRGR
jgi:hypothetical protein